MSEIIHEWNSVFTDVRMRLMRDEHGQIAVACIRNGEISYLAAEQPGRAAKEEFAKVVDQLAALKEERNELAVRFENAELRASDRVLEDARRIAALTKENERLEHEKLKAREIEVSGLERLEQALSDAIRERDEAEAALRWLTEPEEGSTYPFALHGFWKDGTQVYMSPDNPHADACRRAHARTKEPAT